MAQRRDSPGLTGPPAYGHRANPVFHKALAPDIRFCEVAMGCVYMVLLLLEVARSGLCDGDAAMLPAGAPNRDGELRLALRDV